MDSLDKQTQATSSIRLEHPADEGATTAQPVVRLSHVSLFYEHGVQALHDVTLTIPPGERLCVLGANGSGKSTLASVICGLLAPDEGEVSLAGEQVCGSDGANPDAYRRARRHLGLVFQNPDDQIVTTIVEDDVAFGPENLGFTPQHISQAVSRELKRVAMDGYAKADPTRLSGGQKQRVAIAGALAMEPDVLVLDEPGGLLDVRGRRSIMRVMDRLHAAGTTVVHVTHFMDEALAADRVIVLDHGSIVLEGAPEEVFSHEEKICALGLEMPRACQLTDLLEERGMHLARTTSDEALIHEIVASLQMGRSGKALRDEEAPNTSMVPLPAPPATSTGQKQSKSDASDTPNLALAAEHVSFSYHDLGSRLALDDVSLRVPAGSTCAIIGQTGSGKSTLGRILACLASPDTGHVLVDGTDMGDRRARRALRGRVGYVMQHPERQLFAETVADDVAFGPKNLGLSGEALDQRTREALAAVGLEGKAEVSPFELSGGQQRLCAIAGILAIEPSVLILDEPTAGLDPKGRRQLRAILARQNARGITIVQITHSMEDAAHADQVLVLNEGKKLFLGTPEEVFSPEHAAGLSSCGLGLPWPLCMTRRLEEAGISGLGAPLSMDRLADILANKRISIPGSEATS